MRFFALTCSAPFALTCLILVIGRCWRPVTVRFHLQNGKLCYDVYLSFESAGLEVLVAGYLSGAGNYKTLWYITPLISASLCFPLAHQLQKDTATCCWNRLEAEP